MRAEATLSWAKTIYYNNKVHIVLAQLNAALL